MQHGDSLCLISKQQVIAKYCQMNMCVINVLLPLWEKCCVQAVSSAFDTVLKQLYKLRSRIP